MSDFSNRTALVRMKAPAFRRRGRQYQIHKMVGIKKEKWDDMPFNEKIKSVQNYYITLSKRPKLTTTLRKHLNGMKRWFNIQKRKHKPWRSRIQNFFQRKVKRIQEQKKRRGEKKAAQNEMDLRRALVRLAYQRPEMRDDLLPLIMGE
jgi:hypothetical protein